MPTRNAWPIYLPKVLTVDLDRPTSTSNMDRSFETERPSTSHSVEGQGPPHAAEEQTRDWFERIENIKTQETRDQPWKSSFGTLTGGLGDEDWINYPAIFDMAKKGIKG